MNSKLKSIEVNGTQILIRLNTSKDSSPTSNKVIFNNKVLTILNKCTSVTAILTESKALQEEVSNIQAELSCLCPTKNNRAYKKCKLKLKRAVKAQKSLGNAAQAILASAQEDASLNKQSYRYKARFVINGENISYIKGYELLQKVGFYNRINNPLGVVRDHRFSIKSGMDLNIPPEYLGNISNCEFLLFKDNLVKSSSNSISLEEFCELSGYLIAKASKHG